MITLWYKRDRDRDRQRERQRERERQTEREREQERFSEREREIGGGREWGMQIFTNSESQASHHVLFIHGTCSKLNVPVHGTCSKMYL